MAARRISASDREWTSHHEAAFASRALIGRLIVGCRQDSDSGRYVGVGFIGSCQLNRGFVLASLYGLFSFLPRLICAEEPNVVPHIENSAPHRLVIFFRDPVGVLHHGILPPAIAGIIASAI